MKNSKQIIVEDIKYLEDLDLSAEEILDNILSTYRNDAGEKIIIDAFKDCGYIVTL